MRTANLIITADDYGYRPAYNRGILELARPGAIDAVSAMVEREWCEPVPLLDTGVEIGLHLELPPIAGERAGKRQREEARAVLLAQLRRFEALFGRPPAYLDGHRHCHAAPGLGAMVARIARERRLPVRSTDARHRRLLRCQGVPTPDRLVGRLREQDSALPVELRPLVERKEEAPPGVTEWVVHPGHQDPASGSSYDAGREEDLRLMLELSGHPEVRKLRTTHSAALLTALRPG